MCKLEEPRFKLKGSGITFELKLTPVSGVYLAT